MNKPSNKILNTKQLNLLISFLLIICMVSCSEDSQTKNGELDRILVDIPLQIKTDLAKMNASSLIKIVSINGDSETQTIENPDWNNELSLFFNSDINKPAWVEKYSVQKIGNKTIIETTDEKLIIKKVQIEADKIQIEKDKSNMLYTSKETLIWQPSTRSYSISSDRKVVLGDSQEIRIKGQIK